MKKSCILKILSHVKMLKCLIKYLKYTFYDKKYKKITKTNSGDLSLRIFANQLSHSNFKL